MDYHELWINDHLVFIFHDINDVCFEPDDVITGYC